MTKIDKSLLDKNFQASSGSSGRHLRKRKGQGVDLVANFFSQEMGLSADYRQIKNSPSILDLVKINL